MAWWEAPTEKQLAWIEDIEDQMGRSAPRFTGSTRRDAAEYINRYGKLAYELSGIEFDSQHGDWGDRGE